MSKLLAFPLLILITISSVYSQQANVNIEWNPQKNVQKLLPFGTRVLSPEVFDDHTVIFRVYAPRANEIMISLPGGIFCTFSFYQNYGGTIKISILING